MILRSVCHSNVLAGVDESMKAMHVIIFPIIDPNAEGLFNKLVPSFILNTVIVHRY